MAREGEWVRLNVTPPLVAFSWGTNNARLRASICDVVAHYSSAPKRARADERVFCFASQVAGCSRRYTYVLTAFGWGVFHPALRCSAVFAVPAGDAPP